MASEYLGDVTPQMIVGVLSPTTIYSAPAIWSCSFLPISLGCPHRKAFALTIPLSKMFLLQIFASSWPLVPANLTPAQSTYFKDLPQLPSRHLVYSLSSTCHSLILFDLISLEYGPRRTGTLLSRSPLHLAPIRASNTWKTSDNYGINGLLSSHTQAVLNDLSLTHPHSFL